MLMVLLLLDDIPMYDMWAECNSVRNASLSNSI